MRVREIRKAEDVLTRPERTVYESLWGGKRQQDDHHERIVRKGYDVIAKESSITKRNVVNIVHRLVDKGFIELVAPPTIFGERVPTTYRVRSYATVREHQKRSGHDYFVRIGNGFFLKKGRTK